MPRTSKGYDAGYRDGYKAAVAELEARRAAEPTDIDLYGLETVETLLRAKTGYLRAGLGLDGLLYTRYKWTCGPYEEHYTFGSGQSLGFALANVAEHADQVEAGKRKPLLDRPYRKYPPKG